MWWLAGLGSLLALGPWPPWPPHRLPVCSQPQQLASSRQRGPRGRKPAQGSLFFYHLISEGTHICLHHILLATWTHPDTGWEERARDRSTRSRYCWEPSRRLVNILMSKHWPMSQATVSPTMMLRKIILLTILRLGLSFISLVFIESQLWALGIHEGVKQRSSPSWILYSVLYSALHVADSVDLWVQVITVSTWISHHCSRLTCIWPASTGTAVTILSSQNKGRLLEICHNNIISLVITFFY